MAVCLSRSALGVRYTLERSSAKSSEAAGGMSSFFSPKKREEGLVLQSKKVETGVGPGYISLSRSLEMDRLDIDLTEKLVKPVDQETDNSSENVDATATKWRFAPTRGERKSWTPRQTSARWSEEKVVADPSAQQKAYEQLKVKLQLITVGFGSAGVVCSYFVYSPETSLSYGIGLVGSIVYLRMLSKTVEGLGKRSLGGALSNAMGQPRLLVPVVLTMALNRWNALLVPKFGIVELQVLPMFIGFFSYKAATIVQVVQDALPKREA